MTSKIIIGIILLLGFFLFQSVNAEEFQSPNPDDILGAALYSAEEIRLEICSQSDLTVTFEEGNLNIKTQRINYYDFDYNEEKPQSIAFTNLPNGIRHQLPLDDSHWRVVPVVGIIRDPGSHPDFYVKGHYALKDYGIDYIGANPQLIPRNVNPKSAYVEVDEEGALLLEYCWSCPPQCTSLDLLILSENM